MEGLWVGEGDGMILQEVPGDFREIAKPLAAWRVTAKRQAAVSVLEQSNNYSCLSAAGGSAGFSAPFGISIGSGVAFGGGGVGAPLPQHESVPQQASPPLPVV
jgi:hypothetical protein